LQNTEDFEFYSALYNSPFSTRWFVLTFGTDTSLTTSEGWDNVTGLGTPNGKSFVDAVTSAARTSAEPGCRELVGRLRSGRPPAMSRLTAG